MKIVGRQLSKKDGKLILTETKELGISSTKNAGEEGKRSTTEENLTKEWVELRKTLELDLLQIVNQVKILKQQASEIKAMLEEINNNLNE